MSVQLLEEAPPPISSPPVVEVNTRKLFEVLTACWKNDLNILGSSNPAAVLNNVAYRMTIDLGATMLPLIFNDYAREDHDWAPALSAIVGSNPVKPEHWGRFKLVREDWLEWGKAHGYL